MQRRRIAAYGLCRDDRGRVLLVRLSAATAEPGRWLPPGGGVRQGEHPAHTVVREVAEETGLAVRVIRLRTVVADVVTLPEAAVHADRIVYDVEVHGGTLRDEAGGTTDRCDWVPQGTSAGCRWWPSQPRRSACPGPPRSPRSRRHARGPGPRPRRARAGRARRPPGPAVRGVRPGHRSGRAGAADPDRARLPGRRSLAPAGWRHRVRGAAHRRAAARAGGGDRPGGDGDRPAYGFAPAQSPRARAGGPPDRLAHGARAVPGAGRRTRPCPG